MAELPEPVRQPKVGGGDYRLKATESGWSVTDWTKGVGRRCMREGTDLSDGPRALLEQIVTDCLKHYINEAESHRMLCRGADLKLNGFRPGWQLKQADARSQKYRRTVESWYRGVAQLIKTMQVANWSMNVQALAEYVESNLPKKLPECPSTKSTALKTTANAS